MARNGTGVTRSHTASSPLDKVEAELVRLASANHNAVARRWRVLFGQPAPELPRWLLQRIVGYRLQADAARDLDPATLKLLDRLSRSEIADIPLPELRAAKRGDAARPRVGGNAPARWPPRFSIDSKDAARHPPGAMEPSGFCHRCYD